MCYCQQLKSDKFPQMSVFPSKLHYWESFLFQIFDVKIVHIREVL